MAGVLSDRLATRVAAVATHDIGAPDRIRTGGRHKYREAPDRPAAVVTALGCVGEIADWVP
jgi:hypothetical protein